jgi:hypothetical protein
VSEKGKERKGERKKERVKERMREMSEMKQNRIFKDDVKEIKEDAKHLNLLMPGM